MKILNEWEGPRGGRAWLEGREESCRPNEGIIAYRYSLSINTYNRSVCCGIARAWDDKRRRWHWSCGFDLRQEGRAKPAPSENQTPRVRHPNSSQKFRSAPPAVDTRASAGGFIDSSTEGIVFEAHRSAGAGQRWR